MDIFMGFVFALPLLACVGYMAEIAYSDEVSVKFQNGFICIVSLTHCFFGLNCLARARDWILGWNMTNSMGVWVLALSAVYLFITIQEVEKVHICV